MSRWRIGIAFFYHESHTFSPVKTGIEDFRKEGYHRGEEIIDVYQNTRTECGGFIDALREQKAEMVPLVTARAVPSGTVTREAYEVIKNDLLRAIRSAGRLDGILLALHGAMVVEGVSDPETAMLKEIRSLVGDEIPIATTLDLHANVSEQMIQYTPLHFGFKTYPHVDMYEQGRIATEVLFRSLNEGTRYVCSLAKLPLLLPSINMRTDSGPMHDLVEQAKEAERNRQEVVAVTVFGGFPYSDIPESGASVLVVGTEPSVTEQTARELALALWSRREDFLVDLPTVEEAVQLAMNHQSDKPVVLADISDNPLSGGTGDTTALLRQMVKADVKEALFGALFDHESLEACFQAGEGATIELQLGGKLAPQFGQPVPVTAEVIRLSDGIFRNTGPMNTGLEVDTQGAAHIRVNDLDILIIGRALSANDPELFRHIGIEPTDKKILGLKVKNHFRAAFEPLVDRIINVDAPGLASNRFSSFPFAHVPRPIWPMDSLALAPEQIVVYTP